jgi:hypothetical protein
LSAAELRVLELLPTHLSLREIGDQLYTSRNTVKSHVAAIYGQLGLLHPHRSRPPRPRPRLARAIARRIRPWSRHHTQPPAWARHQLRYTRGSEARAAAPAGQNGCPQPPQPRTRPNHPPVPRRTVPACAVQLADGYRRSRAARPPCRGLGWPRARAARTESAAARRAWLVGSIRASLGRRVMGDVGAGRWGGAQPGCVSRG